MAEIVSSQRDFEGGVRVNSGIETIIILGFGKFFYRPWHCLYFLPLPQGQGELRGYAASASKSISEDEGIRNEKTVF